LHALLMVGYIGYIPWEKWNYFIMFNQFTLSYQNM
jgi:hypothetical protein